MSGSTGWPRSGQGNAANNDPEREHREQEVWEDGYIQGRRSGMQRMAARELEEALEHYAQPHLIGGDVARSALARYRAATKGGSDGS